MSAAAPSAFATALLALVATASHAFAQEDRRPETYQVAIGLLQRGLHDEAAGYLERFLKDAPQHALAAEAHYRLALCREQLQQPDAAIASLQQALQRGGQGFALRAEARYRLGGLLQAKGDAAAAAAQFEGLAGEVAEDHYLAAAARYAAGEARRDAGDDDKAAAGFAMAAKLAVGERASFLFPSLYQLGFAELRRNRFAPAAKAFEQASAAAPDDAARAECSYLVGDARLRLGEHEAAARAFAAAEKLGGDFADDACYGLGWALLGRGDRAAAKQAFGRLLQQHPDSAFVGPARLEVARCCYQEQDYAGAETLLAPLLAGGHALEREARELAGLCALATGAGEAAVATLQQALADAAPADRPRLSFALAEALSTLGRYEDALQAYDRVPKDAPTELYGDALYGACHALHELSRHEQSIARAQALLELEPAHRSRPLARLAIAENRFALRDYAAAEAAFAALEKDEAHAAAARWKLAWCRYLQGDRAAAAERFAAIAAMQGDANAEEALAMQALALLEAGDKDRALATADRYAARHKDGRFLDRTERIAARVLRQRGELDAARQRLARAAKVAAARDGAEAAGQDVAEQAELAYQQGDYRTADGLFRELEGRADAAGARALAGRAWCAFELGDDEGCLQALAQAKRHPAAKGELAGLLELESALQHRRQAWPEAAKAAEAFLAQFPKHEKAAQLRFALGVAKAREGEHAKAREVFTQLAAEGSHPQPDRVRYELAWACRRGGDEQAALEHFAELARTTQDVELGGEARLFVGEAMLAQQEPDLDAARKWLEAVEGSHRPQALYRIGFAELQAAGAAEDSAQRALLTCARDHFALLEALPGHDLSGEALYLGGECCRRLGDAPGAFRRGLKLLDVAPEHARAQAARLLVGQCALDAGQPAQAVAPLERFLREHDVDQGDAARADAARANLWLGRARLAQRQHDEAERCFLRTTELSDGALAAEAQFRLGESRAQRGDPNGAVDAFVKLPILYSEARWVRLGLLRAGETYLALRQPDKARRFLAELVEQHSGSDEAKTAARLLQDR